MVEIKAAHPPLVEISSRLSVFLLDRLHQDMGNKYYKLLPNLDFARATGRSTLVSFGGAWSNHIHTLAKIGEQQGFRTVGVIRGEPPKQPGDCLADAVRWGMQLEFVSRSEYREKDSTSLMRRLKSQYGDFYLIPEGGSNRLAVAGCQQIVSDLNLLTSDYDLIVLPVGTGGTLAGVVAGLDGQHNVLGIAVLKGADFLNSDVSNLLKSVACYQDNWSINLDSHCGGYARCPPLLRDFILAFEVSHGIQLDPVYTGKMMLAIAQLRKSGEIPATSRVVALHTGGLQGRRGFDF